MVDGRTAGAGANAPADERSPSDAAFAATLVDTLAEEIQAEIVSGELPIGSWLRQETLAERFGVSRMPIREALRKLQGTNFVDHVPNRGAVVRMPTSREVSEAFLVRAELEGLTAELAAGRARPHDIKRLREAYDAWSDVVAKILAGNSYDDQRAAALNWIRAHNLVHETIHRTADNPTLAQFVHELHGRSPRSLVWSALGSDREWLQHNVECHREIIDAVEAREPLRARSLIRDLILEDGDRVVLWLERRPTTGRRSEP